MPEHSAHHDALAETVCVNIRPDGDYFASYICALKAEKSQRRAGPAGIFNSDLSKPVDPANIGGVLVGRGLIRLSHRSEEHTSELQSRGHLVCRLLLEKKNTK